MHKKPMVSTIDKNMPVGIIFNRIFNQHLGRQRRLNYVRNGPVVVNLWSKCGQK